LQMGSNTFETADNICSKADELVNSNDPKEKPSMNDPFEAEDSTLSINEAVDLVNKCIQLKTQEEKLKKIKEVGSKTPILASEIGTDPNYKFTVVWFNYIGFIILHIIGYTGMLAAILGYCKIQTTLYCE
jgi:hypothetical protein